VITKWQHEEHREHATEFLNEIVDKIVVAAAESNNGDANVVGGDDKVNSSRPTFVESVSEGIADATFTTGVVVDEYR
jgi:hypothetical protein